MSEASGKQIMIRGAAWALGMRWGTKALGLINTLVMARILMPSDYGVVAMGSAVAGLIHALLDFGAETALLRKAQVDSDEINSVWTIRLLQGLFIGLLLVLLSPVANLYFSEPRVTVVLLVFGVSVAVSGATNIGLTLASKKYNYVIEFKVSIFSAVIRVAVTIISGVLLRDYRALIVGVVVGDISRVALSYFLHPYRPHWNTRKIGEVWAITKWLMLSNVGFFFVRRADELIGGRIAVSPGQFGAYTVGSDLGQLPTSEVGPAMQRAALPLFSSMSESIRDINTAVVKVIGAVNTITLPLGLGLAALAGPFTALVLGPNWDEAHFYIGSFAVVGALQSMPGPLKTLLVTRGHTKQHSVAVWLEFGAFGFAALVLCPMLSLAGLVWARAVGAAVGFVSISMFVRGLCQLSFRALWRGLWRPLFGALSMYALVRFVSSDLQSPVEQLIIGICVGALYYISWCLFAWRIVGRPDGFEKMVLGWLARQVGARQSG